MANSEFVPSTPHSAFRTPHLGWGAPVRIVDSHVHFWDPEVLHYPWLTGVPPLHRAFLPRDYAAATGQIPIGRMVFVEANCRADEAGREVEFVERLVRAEPRLAGIVAFVDLAQGIGTRGSGLGKTLDALSRSPRVKGMRQNIQGQPAGFCRQRSFVEGVREEGRRGAGLGTGTASEHVTPIQRLVRGQARADV